VGVLNKSGDPIPGISIGHYSPAIGADGQGLFSFDGDGVCGIDPNTSLPFSPRPSGCPFGATGYEGPGTQFGYYSNTQGNLRFSGGLANNAFAYFTLESILKVAACVTCPSSVTSAAASTGPQVWTVAVSTPTVLLLATPEPSSANLCLEALFIAVGAIQFCRKSLRGHERGKPRADS
jgi:hypothetical protein